MKILFRLFLILLLLVVFSLIVDLSEKTPELYLSKSFLYYGIPINVLYSAATLLIFGLYWVLKKKGPQNHMILDFKSKTWMQKLDFEPWISGFLLGMILIQCIFAALVVLIGAIFRYLFV